MAKKTAARKRARSGAARAAGKTARAKGARGKGRPGGGTGAAKAAAPDKRNGRKDTGKLFEGLVALQAQLCAPGGCPWDREQTHESLRTYLVEEAYEVLDALDSGDAQKFAGELGDLLLQIVFHAELAREAGRFDIGDVIEQIHAKMVRRHPHVFGDAEADTPAQVLKNWEQIKAEERKQERRAGGTGAQAGESERAPSILDAVPRSLPGLLEAHQLTRRAANVGFDWQSAAGIFEKLAEETRELRAELGADADAPKAELKKKDSGSAGARREEEIGDLLFACVNLARFLGFDAEIALKKANRKFSERFRGMERMAATEGKKLGEMPAEQLEELWNRVKAAEA